MLIYSMSVSVDGFINDREGGFDWTTPSEELFRFHTDRVRALGGYLCGRRLYETDDGWGSRAAVLGGGSVSGRSDLLVWLPRGRRGLSLV